MEIINSREFRKHQKKYFEMVDNNEQVIVKRKNKSYKIVPVNEDDMVLEIPLEHRVDPYEISPSGDVFWADKRNIQKLNEAIKESESKEVAKKVDSSKSLKNSLNPQLTN